MSFFELVQEGTLDLPLDIEWLIYEWADWEATNDIDGLYYSVESESKFVVPLQEEREEASCLFTVARHGDRFRLRLFNSTDKTMHPAWPSRLLLSPARFALRPNQGYLTEWFSTPESAGEYPWRVCANIWRVGLVLIDIRPCTVTPL